MKSIPSMDGVDFLLNKKDVKLKYLKDKDSLEALWLDLENPTANVRFN